MRLGSIQVYNEVGWIGFAIDQAMKICDKVVVTEGYQHVTFPGISIRSDDGTLDILSSKARQYAGRLELLNTIREYSDIRNNQCVNFNRVLECCSLGDYFLILDADEFFTDEWIEVAIGLMKEGKADLISTTGCRTFGISFSWRIIFGTEKPAEIIIKKTEGLKFWPTHITSGAGKNRVIIPDGGRFHYMWVKPTRRMRLRMQALAMYGEMSEWFDKSWLSLKPEDGKKYGCYNKASFMLRRYNGEHPVILDSHPWRYVKDIRRIKQ